MSIQKRSYTKKGKNGRPTTRTVWRVRWVDPATGEHRSKQFDSYADAQAFDGQTKAGPSVALPQRAAVLVTLGDVWNEWFPVYSATLAKNTRDGYQTSWDTHVGPYLGRRPLTDFETSFPAEQLHAEMARNKIGPSAIRKSIMLLKMLVDAAVKYRLIGYNGARTYQLGRRASAKRKRPLVMIPAMHVEQMRATLLTKRRGSPGLTAHQYNLRTVAFLSLLAYAGLRPAEALALRWRDFDELHRELRAGNRVADGDAADPKTPTSIRRVPIIEPLLEDLTVWRGETPYPSADAPIIPARDGMPWNTQALRNWARLVFSPAAAELGLDKVRPYDLRHTWCMSQIRCGWDLVYLAERAGSSAETIATYYLAQPALQRDLGIPGEATPSFEEWVADQRAAVAANKHFKTAAS